MILAPPRNLLLPPAGINPRDWLAWFTAGKGQRNPANGKGKRKGGKTPRNTTGTQCCCGNCNCADYSTCPAGHTPCSFEVAFSGISVGPASTCKNDGTQSAEITTSGTVAGSACVQQGAFFGDGWNNLDAAVMTSDLSGSYFHWLNTSCSGPPTDTYSQSVAQPGTVLLVKTTSTSWDVYIASGGDNIFHGTLTDTPSECDTFTSLTFSNLLGSGPLDFGSGGTVVVTQKCCTSS